MVRPYLFDHSHPCWNHIGSPICLSLQLLCFILQSYCVHPNMHWSLFKDSGFLEKPNLLHFSRTCVRTHCNKRVMFWEWINEATFQSRFLYKSQTPWRSQTYLQLNVSLPGSQSCSGMVVSGHLRAVKVLALWLKASKMQDSSNVFFHEVAVI